MLDSDLSVGDWHSEALTRKLWVWRPAGGDELAPLAGPGSERGHHAPYDEHWALDYGCKVSVLFQVFTLLPSPPASPRNSLSDFPCPMGRTQGAA